MKKVLHIEFVATDISEFALMGFGSIKNCRNVYDSLYEEYSNVKFNIVRNENDLYDIVSKKPDLVFSGIKYILSDTDKGNKIWISEFFEKANINFIGSKNSSIKLEYDKSLAKKRVSEFGINTVPYFVSKPGLHKNILPLSFPLFVKPLCEGNSKGIGLDSVVNDFASFRKKVEDIYNLFKQPSLVEKYMEGREFTVSVIRSVDDNFRIMPVELIVSDSNPINRILGYKAKSENKELVVKIVNKKILKSIMYIAKESFIALGARDYGRIDIIMDKENKPYFMEANLIPGMTKRLKENNSSYFTRACYINDNMTYKETIIEITEIALERIRKLQTLKSS
jgi:D-alanine-D-alanine ligase